MHDMSDVARREQIAVRLAPAALAEVDKIATDREWTRSQTLRELLRLGLIEHRRHG